MNITFERVSRLTILLAAEQRKLCAELHPEDLDQQSRIYLRINKCTSAALEKLNNEIGDEIDRSRRKNT